ncbi:MAG: hypothetical protein ABIE74_10210 [Pseudomonadota bacterium]
MADGKAITSIKERGNRSILFCKLREVPEFHLFFGKLQNIDSLLQTKTRDGFSQIRLSPIVVKVGWMTEAILFPVTAMILSPVLQPFEIVIPVLLLPAFVTEKFLLMFTFPVSTGDLPIT